MLLHKQNGSEKKLTLRDYVTVNMQGAKESQANNGALQDVLVQHEAFFQRILKQRGEMYVVQKVTDSVIIVDKRPCEELQDSSLRCSTG